MSPMMLRKTTVCGKFDQSLSVFVQAAWNKHDQLIYQSMNKRYHLQCLPHETICTEQTPSCGTQKFSCSTTRWTGSRLRYLPRCQVISSAATRIEVSVGGMVIAHLAESFPIGTWIYCDRYFTSVALIDYMLSQSMYVTGTMMKNQIPKLVVKMSDDKSLMKRGRGACDQFVRGDDKVEVLKWYDNKPIWLASSTHGEQPHDECRQWCKTEKSHILVPRPTVW